MARKINKNRLIDTIWTWRRIRENIEYITPLYAFDKKKKERIIKDIELILRYLESEKRFMR